MKGSEEGGSAGGAADARQAHESSRHERKAAKRAAKVEAKAARARAKAEASAANGTEKADAKARKHAAKADVKAVRRTARALSKAEKRTARAAKRTARAEKRTAQAAAERETKAAKTAGRGVSVGAGPEPAPLSPAVAAVSTNLEEAAELVRQAGDPPAARMLERAEERFAAELSPEPEADAAAEPDSEPEPEPEADAVADSEPDSEPEPDAEPEPASVAVLPPGATPAALPAPEVAAAFSVRDGALVAASIDVGSTSVHLLVGIVEGHQVEAVLDESVFLGLGDRVSAEGFLGAQLLEALAADLSRYVATARELGATSVTIVGTEPMRRAEDAASVVHEVEHRAGVALHVLDHAEEGLLTLLGATGGRPVDEELLLVDIGGGSSEFVSVLPGGHVGATGIQLGAARLTRTLVHSDPPSQAELEALRQEVARLMAGAPDAHPDEIVAVGGTASNLLRLLPATAVDRALTRRRIAVALAMLTVERSLEAAARHVIRPERARILPAGAIIVDAILERYGVDRLRVSEAGIREGAILAVVHGGAAWRDQLGSMARGWREPAVEG